MASTSRAVVPRTGAVRNKSRRTPLDRLEELNRQSSFYGNGRLRSGLSTIEDLEVENVVETLLTAQRKMFAVDSYWGDNTGGLKLNNTGISFANLTQYLREGLGSWNNLNGNKLTPEDVEINLTFHMGAVSAANDVVANAVRVVVGQNLRENIGPSPIGIALSPTFVEPSEIGSRLTPLIDRNITQMTQFNVLRDISFSLDDETQFAKSFTIYLDGADLLPITFSNSVDDDTELGQQQNITYGGIWIYLCSSNEFDATNDQVVMYGSSRIKFSA